MPNLKAMMVMTAGVIRPRTRVPESPAAEETQGQREARVRAELLKKSGYDLETDAESAPQR